jgi:hypothetical protein
MGDVGGELKDSKPLFYSYFSVIVRK